MNENKRPTPIVSSALLGRIVEIITSYTGQNPDEVTRETNSEKWEWIASTWWKS